MSKKRDELESMLGDDLEEDTVNKTILKMPPKKNRKKSTNKSSTKTHQATVKSNKLEEQMLQNLVALQKVNTHMAEKFDALADQIQSLLKLFEMTAMSFAKQPHLKVAEKDKEFLNKIDKLLEQNKTIAKGLTLMEKKVREKVYGPISPGSSLGTPRQPRQTI